MKVKLISFTKLLIFNYPKVANRILNGKDRRPVPSNVTNFYKLHKSVRQQCVAFSLLRNNVFKTYSNNAVDVNTNVVKDVILYKYDNPKFFKYINLFALCQFGFWSYLSHFAYTTLRDAPIEKSENVSWWRKINLGENKYKHTITILCFLIGYGVLTVAWMYTLRSVRYLVLRKGGSEVTIVTYTPLGKNRMMTVPLSDINCKQARTTAVSQVPIKVKHRYLHYILDMKGEFRNTELFDHTAGLRRNWK